MNNITCPCCNRQLTGPFEMCAHTDFLIKCYTKPFEYLIDILVDGKKYGLDSHSKLNKTWLYLITNNKINNTNFKKLVVLDYYTPIPESKEAVELLVQRLLNLQIFS